MNDTIVITVITTSTIRSTIVITDIELNCASRFRIKISCARMRQLIPGIPDRTPVVKTFELAADYLEHLKQYTTDSIDEVKP